MGEGPYAILLKKLARFQERISAGADGPQLTLDSLVDAMPPKAPGSETDPPAADGEKDDLFASTTVTARDVDDDAGASGEPFSLAQEEDLAAGDADVSAETRVAALDLDDGGAR